jgi:hypothetical protein
MSSILLFIVPLITIIQCQPITTILAHFDFETPVDHQGTFRDSSGNNVQAKLQKLAQIVDNPVPSTIVKANNSVLQVFGSGSRALIGKQNNAEEIFLICCPLSSFGVQVVLKMTPVYLFC